MLVISRELSGYEKGGFRKQLFTVNRLHLSYTQCSLTLQCLPLSTALVRIPWGYFPSQFQFAHGPSLTPLDRGQYRQRTQHWQRQPGRDLCDTDRYIPVIVGEGKELLFHKKSWQQDMMSLNYGYLDHKLYQMIKQEALFPSWMDATTTTLNKLCPNIFGTSIPDAAKHEGNAMKNIVDERTLEMMLLTVTN